MVLTSGSPHPPHHYNSLDQDGPEPFLPEIGTREKRVQSHSIIITGVHSEPAN